MAVRLQRHLGRVESLEPGQYTVETATGMPALCCPGCASIFDLSMEHTIDDDGRVAPAVKCGNPICSFFDWVHLQAFSEDVLS